MANNYLDILKRLSRQKQLTFGLLAAERYIDGYKLFNKKEEFGDVICMLNSLRIIEKAAISEKVEKKELENLIRQVDENTPDMDDFGSVGSSLALNTSVIIYETLNLAINFEEGQLEGIGTMCTDTIYFVILEIENYDQKDFEKINSHSLMKEEIQIQKSIVEYLEKIPDVDFGDIEALRLMQNDREFNKLDLETVLYS